VVVSAHPKEVCFVGTTDRAGDWSPLSVEAQMTSDENDSGRMLDKAAEAVRGATEAVQATSESIASAIDEG